MYIKTINILSGKWDVMYMYIKTINILSGNMTSHFPDNILIVLIYIYMTSHFPDNILIVLIYIYMTSHFPDNILIVVADKFCEQIYVTGNDGNVICFISFYERQVAFVKQKQNKTSKQSKNKTKKKTTTPTYNNNISYKTNNQPLTLITPPHICACPKPEHGFPKSYEVVFFALRRKL
jgi:hypothetical protein